MASNGISLEGGSYLIEILKENTTLKHLDLGYAISTKVLMAEKNDLGDAFATLFRDFLKINKSLHCIDLTNANISPRGVKTIEEGILENTHLGKLKINGKLSETAKKHLQSNERDDFLAPSKEVQAIKNVYQTR